MIQPFNTTQLIALLYLVIAVITILIQISKHNYFEAIYILLGMIWPLYWFAVLLTSAMDEYVAIIHKKRSKKKNFLTNTHEGKAFVNKHNIQFKNKARVIKKQT